MAMLDRLTHWLHRHPSASPAVAPEAAVIVDGGPPADESAAVRHLAEQLRQRDLAAGGWAAEAGGLSLESYLPEARQLVQRIALGAADGGPPAP